MEVGAASCRARGGAKRGKGSTMAAKRRQQRWRSEEWEGVKRKKAMSLPARTRRPGAMLVDHAGRLRKDE